MDANPTSLSRLSSLAGDWQAGAIDQKISQNAKAYANAVGESGADSFDALFTSMILKELRGSLDEQDGLFAGDSGDVVGGIWDMFLGQQMSQGMSLGLDAMIARDLARKEGIEQP